MKSLGKHKFFNWIGCPHHCAVYLYGCVSVNRMWHKAQSIETRQCHDDTKPNQREMRKHQNKFWCRKETNKNIENVSNLLFVIVCRWLCMCSYVPVNVERCTGIQFPHILCNSLHHICHTLSQIFWRTLQTFSIQNWNGVRNLPLIFQ